MLRYDSPKDTISMTSVMAARRTLYKDASAEPPKKKRRSSEELNGGGGVGGDDDTSTKILLMESGILKSRKNYNDIATLLRIANAFKDGNPEAMLAAVALCRTFVRLLAQGSLERKKSVSEKDAVVVGWLRDHLSQYRSTVLALLKNEDTAASALTFAMRILKAEGEHLFDREDNVFPQAFLEDIVETILLSKNDDIRRAYIEEYAEQYDDIRYFTFSSVTRFLRKRESEEDSAASFPAAFSLLSAFDGIPESGDDLEDFFVPQPKKKTHPLRSVTQHKKQGQSAWLALLSITGSQEQRKQVLGIMSTVIAPWFTKPELLADFLTSSYNAGGSMSLLALSGVFYLIEKRNLDYPSFYRKLYSLLDRDILHSKHRSRFFRLLDTFLASTHLPAALVASFIKRLSRLALNAPPGAIVFVIPWIYNLLKRHPTCSFMIHRDVRDPEVKQNLQDNGFSDPFLPAEEDPMETHAIDSCVWELVQLQGHYHPNVATIARVISSQFTKQSYNIEDFLDHSYASLLNAELGKPVKRAPVIEFPIPKRIFLPHEQDSPVEDGLLVKLWDFSA